MNAETGEQVGGRRCPVEFLDNIETVVEKAGARAVDRLTLASSNRVVLETRSDSWTTQSNELIFGIPGVRRGATGVRHRLEIAVVVIRRTLRP
jgi:hypothetical protein